MGSPFRKMNVPKGFLNYVLSFIFFLPFFVFLFFLGCIKGAVFSPFVLLIIAFGDTGIVIGLWPVHLVWSIYCIIKSKKFGPYMKCLLIVLVPIPIALWTVVGVAGSAVMGAMYGFIWPVMETFRAISKEGSIFMKLIRCFTGGTWSFIRGACTVVRDFADFSFHSYFSVMDELLESNGEEPTELKVTQIPGCILAAVLGIVVDVHVVTIIVLLKSPVMLLKGWHRLIQDLIEREGPFLETVCVPFAALWILLWPIAVLLAIAAGILSSIGFGCFAAVVAYQENSTKMGLLYVIASASIFDEYTNDLLYLQDGSCFPRYAIVAILLSLWILFSCVPCPLVICMVTLLLPAARPRYRKGVISSSSLLPVKGLHERLEAAYVGETLVRTPADKANTLTATMIWDSLLKAFEDIGKELLIMGAIGIPDLDAWADSKSKIVDIGIPAHAFLGCFLRSIKHGSNGFILRDNVEITRLNRPEGKIFDWLFEPMCIMKEQINSLKLDESESLYFYKHCLYGGDAKIIGLWQNGGTPPLDEIKRAQLEGLSRRLQGFCLTLSRLPTSRRRFSEVVKAIEQEAKNCSNLAGGEDLEAAR